MMWVCFLSVWMCLWILPGHEINSSGELWFESVLLGFRSQRRTLLICHVHRPRFSSETLDGYHKSIIWHGYTYHHLEDLGIFFTAAESRFLIVTVVKNEIFIIFQNQQAGQSKNNEEKSKSSPTEVARIAPHVELPAQVLQVSRLLAPSSFFVKRKTSQAESIVFVKWGSEFFQKIV